MRRRQFLVSAACLATGALVGGGLWQLPRAKELISLPALAQFLRELPTEALASRGQFSSAQAFVHCAQSVHFSIDGYPALKAPWFRESIGRGAFALFSLREGMRHDLAEPIPGAQTLPDNLNAAQGLAELIQAIERFQNHQGALQPHFAYGALSHAQYAKAHAMHIIEHLTEMTLS